MESKVLQRIKLLLLHYSGTTISGLEQWLFPWICAVHICKALQKIIILISVVYPDVFCPFEIHEILQAGSDGLGQWRFPWICAVHICKALTKNYYSYFSCLPRCFLSLWDSWDFACWLRLHMSLLEASFRGLQLCWSPIFRFSRVTGSKLNTVWRKCHCWSKYNHWNVPISLKEKNCRFGEKVVTWRKSDHLDEKKWCFWEKWSGYLLSLLRLLMWHCCCKSRFSSSCHCRTNISGEC